MTTFLILLLFALIFLVAGGALLYFRCRTEQKAALMGQTETSNASDVSGLAPGTLVEVEGTLRCEEPLTSEMAGERCAYYSSKVVREYLERDYDDDDDDVGSDRRSEVVAHNEQFAPFTVEDETGTVAVNAEGAEVDARQAVNRFERNTGSEGPSISLGGATIHLGVRGGLPLGVAGIPCSGGGGPSWSSPPRVGPGRPFPQPPPPLQREMIQ